MRCSARGALPGSRRLLEPKDSFNLIQLRVGVLQFSSSPDKHVHADAIAYRHLVHESAKVPLELGHPRVELIAPTCEVNETGIGHGRRERALGRARWAAPSLAAGRHPDHSAGGVAGAPHERRRAHGPKNVPVKWPLLQPGVPAVQDWPVVTVGALGALAPSTLVAAAAAAFVAFGVR
jgi:hypothetical protein